VAFGQECLEQNRPKDQSEKSDNQNFHSAPGDWALRRSRQERTSADAKKPKPEDGQGGDAGQQEPGLEIEAKLCEFGHRGATQFDTTDLSILADCQAMSTILDKIVASKQREIEETRKRVSEAELERQLAEAPPVRAFAAALAIPGEIQVIAEVKKASPSAGVIRSDFDPVAIAQAYERHGAACISVLTDAPFFQGSLSHLSVIRTAVLRPLLRKDFILDRYQLLEARLAGADAVLLIAEILEEPDLPRLLHEAGALGLESLVEFYDAQNLPRVLDSGAHLIGINNRDLRTFVTRLEHTLDLAARVPADRCLVSESGIRTPADVLRLQAAGVRAILVGETLMRAPDLGTKLDELRGISLQTGGRAV
jgi:indole-3-glycerol phosphate synthase